MDYPVAGFTNNYVYCIYNPSTHSVLVKGGFKKSFSDGNPPTLNFSIPYLRNPRAVGSTS
jgi:hypothetical protein